MICHYLPEDMKALALTGTIVYRARGYYVCRECGVIMHDHGWIDTLDKDLREKLARAQVIIDGVGEMYADINFIHDLSDTIKNAYVAYRNKYGQEFERRAYEEIDALKAEMSKLASLLASALVVIDAAEKITDTNHPYSYTQMFLAIKSFRALEINLAAEDFRFFPEEWKV